MTAIESKARVTTKRLELGLDHRAVEQIVEAVLERLGAVGETPPAKAPSRGGDALSPKWRAVDTKTRYQGVYARHQVSCAKALDRCRRCRCKPSFYGSVWEPEHGRRRRTQRRSNAREAKRLRDDLLLEVLEEEAHLRTSELPLERVGETFIADCRTGVALNKQGESYKPNSIRDLESSLNCLPESIRREALGDVTSWQLQVAIDDYRRRGLSGSRIHSIINAVRSLYAWAKHRGKVTSSPAIDLRLPVVHYSEVRRIGKPGEFADLLDRLEAEDALPWAIAAYGTARHQEIQVLRWTEVDFDTDVMLLAEDDKARKSEAAWRVVPLVRPLRARLWAEWIRQGRPKSGRVCPPRRESKSGKLSLNQLSKRIKKQWKELGLTPLGLQDSRHTAATWLDHAGVSPKVASVIMGHKAPNRDLHSGAAPITQHRYTHVLDGELERARDRLDAFLAEREAEERDDDDAAPVAGTP